MTTVKAMSPKKKKSSTKNVTKQLNLSQAPQGKGFSDYFAGIVDGKDEGNKAWTKKEIITALEARNVDFDKNADRKELSKALSKAVKKELRDTKKKMASPSKKAAPKKKSSTKKDAAPKKKSSAKKSTKVVDSLPKFTEDDLPKLRTMIEKVVQKRGKKWEKAQLMDYMDKNGIPYYKTHNKDELIEDLIQGVRRKLLGKPLVKSRSRSSSRSRSGSRSSSPKKKAKEAFYKEISCKETSKRRS